MPADLRKKLSDRKTMVRLLIIIIWLVLLGALLERDYFVETLDLKEARLIKRSREESFSGIYFQKERIGYVKNRLIETEPGRFKMYQEAFLLLNILDENHPVSLRVEADLTEDLLLEKFDFHLASPFYNMAANGTVEDRLVRFSLTTGKETINDTVRLNAPPFLSTNQRVYLLEHDLEKGEKIKVPYFDPISLSGKDTIVEYRGFKKILINGRINRLHHFVETFSGLRINFWLDKQGKVIKEESPAGFVFIAEPEFMATNITKKGKEILSAVSVPLAGRMPETAGLESLSYRLTLPDETDFALNRDRQTMTDDILTVTREALPDDNAPLCSNRKAELEPTPYVQARNPLIVNQSKDLVGDEQSPMARVRILAKWVFDNLEKRPILGIPDAVTTLHTRRGDCNEHASLFAALARSIMIPTRIAAGVVFHQGAFYYHAWNEVCIDDAWISLDTTRDQLPADITHIKFIEGEPQEMVKIGALLGKLKIEVVE